MKMSSRAVASIAASFALASADIASAGEASASLAAGATAESAQRGEIRRPSRALCTGVGIVVGLIAGAVLGRSRRRGGDGFSDTAAVVGGVGAGLICRSIRWRSVAREDQDDVSRKVAMMTLEANPTIQTYRSPTTGQVYTITPGEVTYREINNSQYTTITNVDLPQRGYKISHIPYRVNTAVLNLRATPGSETSDRITGAFYRNDMIETLSETPDGQWVLVGYQGVGYGWVSRRHLTPVNIPYEQITFDRPGPAATPDEIAAASAPPRPAARTTPRRGRGRARARAAPAGPVFVARRITVTPATRTAQVRGQQMPCRNTAVSNQTNQSDRHRGCVRPGGVIDFG